MASEKSKAIQAYGTALRSEGIVTVEVGTERVKYPLHMSVLAYHSEYFARAFNGPWAEADDGKLILEDCDPGTLLSLTCAINVFVKYIYGQGIPYLQREWLEVIEQDGATMTEDEKWQTADLFHVQALHLADRILAKDFKKVLNNSYVDHWRYAGDEHTEELEPCPYPSVIYAFEHFPTNDPLLEFQMHVQASYWKPDHDTVNNRQQELAKELAHDFLRGVLQKAFEMRGKQYADWLFNVCEYHVHDNEAEKEMCPTNRKEKGEGTSEDEQASHWF